MVVSRFENLSGSGRKKEHRQLSRKMTKNLNHLCGNCGTRTTNPVYEKISNVWRPHVNCRLECCCLTFLSLSFRIYLFICFHLNHTVTLLLEDTIISVIVGGKSTYSVHDHTEGVKYSSQVFHCLLSTRIHVHWY